MIKHESMVVKANESLLAFLSRNDDLWNCGNSDVVNGFHDSVILKSFEEVCLCMQFGVEIKGTLCAWRASDVN